MKNISYSISYKNHTPETSGGFYHLDSPVLFGASDVIGELSDCPFPLETDSFKVLLFGKVNNWNADIKDDGKFAVVEYTKKCGHKVQERIAFYEGVQTFDHYGTTFEGISYSIKNWEKRIEFFRTVPCDICSLTKHAHWIRRENLYGKKLSKKAYIEKLRRLLDYNFCNWSDFFDIDGYEKTL